MCYEPIEHFLFLKIMFFFIHMYYTTVDPILMLHMVHLLGISHCAGNHFYLHMNVHINYIILTFYKFTILPVIASTVRHGCLLPHWPHLWSTSQSQATISVSSLSLYWKVTSHTARPGPLLASAMLLCSVVMSKACFYTPNIVSSFKGYERHDHDI